MNRHLIVTIALVIVTFTAFLNILSGSGFVSDDKTLVVENPLVKKLSVSHIGKALSRDFWPVSGQFDRGGYFRPVVALTYMADYFFWELNPFGYHLTNILVHTANVLLCYVFLVLVSRNILIAAIGAAFFSLHPIHVESVAFISGRTDLLAAFFLLMSLLLYGAAVEKKRLHTAVYACSLCVYFMALLAKEVAAVFPLVLAGYHFMPRHAGDPAGLERPRWYYCLPFFLLVFLVFLYKSAIGVVRPQVDYYRGDLIGTLPVILHVGVLYIRKLLFPVDLSFEYDYPLGGTGPVIAGLLMLAVTLWLFLRSWKSDRAVAFGIAWFFILLLPVLGIIPLPVMLADRFLYLPSLGFCLVIALFFQWLLGVLHHKKKIVVTGIMLLFCCMSSLAIFRNAVWQDEVTLWNDAVARFPHCAKARYNRACAYKSSGHTEAAVNDYRKACDLSGGREGILIAALLNIGALYSDAGRYEEAVAEYEKTLAIVPGLEAAKTNIQLVYERQAIELCEQGIECIKGRRFSEAIGFLQHAIELKPDYISAHNNLGICFAKLNRLDEARSKWETVLQLEPDHEVAQRNLRRLEAGAAKR